MVDLKAWFAANPTAAALIGWLVVTLLVWIFKPRTPEEYDRLPPRVAAFLQLLGAVFGDGRKIVEAARKFFTGGSEPASQVRARKRGAAHLPAMLTAFALSGSMGLAVACKPSTHATLAAAQRIEKMRADYREAVLECIRLHRFNCVAFNECQRRAAAARGLPLLGTCEEISTVDAVDAGLPDGAL